MGTNGVRRLRAANTPLGLFRNSTFQVEETALDPGNLLVLFSDGVTDAGTGKSHEFGDGQLASLVSTNAQKPLQEIQQQVLGTLEKWTEHDFEDDFTLLLARSTAARKEDA